MWKIHLPKARLTVRESPLTDACLSSDGDSTFPSRYSAQCSSICTFRRLFIMFHLYLPFHHVNQQLLVLSTWRQRTANFHPLCCFHAVGRSLSPFPVFFLSTNQTQLLQLFTTTGHFLPRRRGLCLFSAQHGAVATSSAMWQPDTRCWLTPPQLQEVENLIHCCLAHDAPKSYWFACLKACLVNHNIPTKLKL